MKFLCLLLLPFQVFAQNSPILFKNVNIIDVEKGQVIMNQNVLVQGNKIEKISSRRLSGKGATIIKAKGKYLMPGLWDMHVHAFNNDAGMSPNEWHLPLFIAHGVTSVRDMWTKPSGMKDINRWRQQLNEKPGTVPRFAAVGTLIDGTPVIMNHSDSVTTAEEARAMVQLLKASGLDFFKVYSNISRESYLAIAEEANKIQFPFSGHAPLSMTFEEVSNSGQKSIEHIGWYKFLLDFSGNPQKFTQLKESEWTQELRLDLIKSFSEDSCRKIATIFAKNKTWLCATTVMIQVSLLGNEASMREDDRLLYVPVSEKEGWLKIIERNNTKTRPTRELRFQKTLNMLKIMHDEGVPLLAGTDLGNAFIFPGASLHDELGLMVAAGLTPTEALKTATINPAVFLNMQKELGTVKAGKLADLVLLDANPLADINNIKKINAVMTNGILLQRKDLDKMLEDAKARVKSSN